MNLSLHEEFASHFQKKPDHIFFCPGRVNLIGEHIDYNGGKVMPCAISLGTYLAIAPNDECIIRFRSMNYPEQGNIPFQKEYQKTGGRVLIQLGKQEIDFSPFR